MKYIIGIDVGGMSAKGGLFDENGTLLCTQTVKTQKEDGFDKTVENIAHLCKQLCAAQQIAFEQVNGIGVGVPGAVDSKKGVVIAWGNFDWHNVPFAQRLSEYTGKQVFIGNDANVAALGEASFGAGAKYESSLLLTLGTGIGSGFVFNGRVIEGYRGMFELGHFVLYPNGINCVCGKRGCFEQYASATALIAQTKEGMLKNPDSMLWDIVENIDVVDGKTVFLGLEKKDKTAMEIFSNYIAHLTDGIVHIINILHPEALLLGGGISNAGDTLLYPLKEQIEKIGYSGMEFAPVAIVRAKLGNNAGIYGAFVLAK